MHLSWSYTKLIGLVRYHHRVTTAQAPAAAEWIRRKENRVPNQTESNQSTRRGFLGGMTALTAASYNRVLGANDRVGIGFIGFGLIGKQHIYNFKKSFPDVDRVALCDVYKPRVEEGLAYMESPNAKGYGDFRKMFENKDIDGVVVATPDHWHAMLTIMACAAGKDVYVEKPLTVFIDEGKWMLQARDKYKRVVVVGTQRNHNPGHQAAKKIIESGVLGKIQMVKLSAGTRNIYPGFGKTPVSDPPSGLDYDMWLGPAPKKPYQQHRSLYHFRWFWDYSGGQLTNLGPSCLAVSYCRLSSWILPRWYMVSMAPSTPPRSLRSSNSRVDGLLDEVGQGLDQERALQGVLRPVQPELPVDDQLDGHRLAHALLRGRRQRLIEGVGVQRVAVVEQRIERLQRRAAVVELDLLRVQVAPEVCTWYLSIWLRAAAP